MKEQIVIDGVEVICIEIGGEDCNNILVTGVDNADEIVRINLTLDEIEDQELKEFIVSNKTKFQGKVQSLNYVADMINFIRAEAEITFMNDCRVGLLSSFRSGPVIGDILSKFMYLFDKYQSSKYTFDQVMAMSAHSIRAALELNDDKYDEKFENFISSVKTISAITNPSIRKAAVLGREAELIKMITKLYEDNGDVN